MTDREDAEAGGNRPEKGIWSVHLDRQHGRIVCATFDGNATPMNDPNQYTFFLWTQVAWIIGSALWFWIRRDELPLVISGFLFYIFSFRFWALINGYTSPVDISPFGFEPMSLSQAAQAQGIATLSESVTLAAYMMVQRGRLTTGGITAPPPCSKDCVRSRSSLRGPRSQCHWLPAG